MAKKQTEQSPQKKIYPNIDLNKPFQAAGKGEPTNLFSPSKKQVTPWVNQLLFDDTKKTVIRITSKIHFILNKLLQDRNIAFPKTHVNVLDLACGLPFPFLALKALLPAGTSMHYTGIDIDATKDGVPKLFSAFPECSIIDGDASQPLGVLQLLKKQNTLVKPFDFIFLRHPDILNSERGAAFRQMVEKVIPFVATKNAFVFISCLNEKETNAIYSTITKDSLKSVYQPISINTFGVKLITIDLEFTKESALDSYTHALRCSGQALTFVNSRERILAWMQYLTHHLTDETLDWKYSGDNEKNSEVVFLTHPNQTLLATIQQYFGKHQMQHLNFGAINGKPGQFCLQIFYPSTQIKVLEQIPPMPATTKPEESEKAVNRSNPGLAASSIWQPPQAQNSATSSSATTTAPVSNTNEATSASTSTMIDQQIQGSPSTPQNL